jgi:hypothetical protein
MTALTCKQALQTLLDQVDYTKKACSPTTMVAAALDTTVIDKCREAIAEEKLYVMVPEFDYNELLEFLEQQEDVRDGDDGRPSPNRAMQLATTLRELKG